MLGSGESGETMTRLDVARKYKVVFIVLFGFILICSGFFSALGALDKLDNSKKPMEPLGSAPFGLEGEVPPDLAAPPPARAQGEPKNSDFGSPFLPSPAPNGAGVPAPP